MNSLYFVEVKADGNSFYKIGMTTRLIEERIAEVQRDVRAHYSDVAVNLLGLWEHRGNVELYFKHPYKTFNYRIEKLTEYFVFPNVKRTLRDLFEMEAKVLDDVEIELVGSIAATSLCSFFYCFPCRRNCFPHVIFYRFYKSFGTGGNGLVEIQLFCDIAKYTLGILLYIACWLPIGKGNFVRFSFRG
ncbi:MULTISPECIES: GIY-YIG nuclease family protein [unclassified Microcoleus]|uniref:GIY-YIG nuclease family protein n=1 Tax=unclassified Microcoleus TaxID=2642155 RepID=UPI002FCF2BBD